MMKFNVKLAVAGLILSLAAISIAAQVEQGVTLKFFVATDFVVNGKTLPAGEYTIERTPNTSDSPSVLVIRGAKSMIFDTMVSDLRDASDRTEIVFENVDGVNYLSRIRVEGHTTVNELPSAKAQMK